MRTRDVDLFVLLIGLTNERGTLYYYKIVPNAKERQLYATADHEHLREFILFAHAFVGCDTTSALYSKGKRTILKLLEKKKICVNFAKSFTTVKQRKMHCTVQRRNSFFHLYGVEGDKITLGAARFERYDSSAVSQSTAVRLASLPSSSAALEEHAKRVYLQMQIWLGNTLRPEDWRWVRSSFVLLPIMTAKAAAPPELLRMVSCGCATDCFNTRCSCRKAGMKCSRFCTHCQGVSCKNAPIVRPDLSMEDDEDNPLDRCTAGELCPEEETYMCDFDEQLAEFESFQT